GVIRCPAMLADAESGVLTSAGPGVDFGRPTDIGQTTERHTRRVRAMTYEIEGRLLEVCTCNVLCPCWVGEDPDYKTCDTTIAWGIEQGTIEGVKVDGLTMAVSAHTPKNILEPKSWKAVVLVDDRATDEQQAELLKLFTGQLGGPIADLAGLIGEVVGVERAPITFSVEGGKGRLTIGTIVDAEMDPYVGATGEP